MENEEEQIRNYKFKEVSEQEMEQGKLIFNSKEEAESFIESLKEYGSPELSESIEIRESN